MKVGSWFPYSKGDGRHVSYRNQHHRAISRMRCNAWGTVSEVVARRGQSIIDVPLSSPPMHARRPRRGHRATRIPVGAVPFLSEVAPDRGLGNPSQLATRRTAGRGLCDSEPAGNEIPGVGGVQKGETYMRNNLCVLLVAYNVERGIINS
jgi:hypothetical protein